MTQDDTAPPPGKGSTEIGKTAALIIVGNEILSGRTQDTNLVHIATALNGVGVRLTEARIIPDIAPVIVATVRDLSDRFDYVFTTGGIGPTHDDITADCVAEAFGVPIGEHPEAMRRLAAHYTIQGVEFNTARRRMARTPEGATLIDNPVSIAPGFRIGNVFVMAGVPRIMQAMLAGILPLLEGGVPLSSVTLACDQPEGALAEALGVVQHAHPSVEIGSYPGFARGRNPTQIVLRTTDPVMLEKAALAVEAMLAGLGARVERITTSGGSGNGSQAA